VVVWGETTGRGGKLIAALPRAASTWSRSSVYRRRSCRSPRAMWFWSRASRYY